MEKNTIEGCDFFLQKYIGNAYGCRTVCIFSFCCAYPIRVSIWLN